ncbi:MAG TPA: HAD-IIA family hydrolase [Mycobacteriales bacterium]|nr:HAD-IIA family hydrolase [Mycobacteriales bacterium]
MTAPSRVPPGLVASSGSLVSGYDLLLLDLDGVVYIGGRAVRGAAEALNAARAAGARVVFLTNNASRPAKVVADQLRGLGVPAEDGEVLTSAMAAARRLAEDLEPGAPVLVVGGDGVETALADAGLRPVRRAEDGPVAVVQGFAPDVGWRSLAEAMVALRAGARWVATNTDKTLPSERGPLPGNGSLVGALAIASGLDPEVIGKPEPALYLTARADCEGARPLGVGDRLDTDIEGARRAGLPSLLVLTGVSTPADVLAARPQVRPNYVGRDLGALHLPHPSVEVDRDRATCGSAWARRDRQSVDISGGSDDPAGDGATPDGLDPFRALCALAWTESADGWKERRGGYVRALDQLGLG